MNDRLQAIIRRHAHPLEPRPTNQQPVLRPLPDVRGVLFDIYGTLIISASGDIHTDPSAERRAAFERAVVAGGGRNTVEGEEGVARLLATIQQVHQQLKEQGTPYPEVDIIDVWRIVLSELDCGVSDDQIEVVAAEYEMQTNPVWAMPECRQTIGKLCDSGVKLGVISNAQAITLELFPALVGNDLTTLGFDDSLCVFSYQHGHAKPGMFLYEQANRALFQQGITAEQVLYVGNDMLKDIWPASRLGFRTALFAGDERSLRLRSDDSRVHRVQSDLVITQLAQLSSCVVPE